MGDLDLALGDGAVDYRGFGMSGKFLGHGRMNPEFGELVKEEVQSADGR